jgi:hypothetical protein
LKKKLHYRSHTSVDKMEAYGLQAADMLAWIMARLAVGVPQNHTMRAFAPIIQTLTDGQSDRYQLFHPKADGLMKFFAQARARQDDRMLVHVEKARKLKLR